MKSAYQLRERMSKRDLGNLEDWSNSSIVKLINKTMKTHEYIAKLFYFKQ